MKIYVGFIFILPLFIFGQKSPTTFIFPRQNNSLEYLSGNMGELRPDHFHGGLDIKPSKEDQEGDEIVAASEGYVEKIGVSTAGYGNVIFLRHPNGQQTIYAHLKEFSPKITIFIRTKQYEQKVFEIFSSLNPNEIKVLAKEVIGYMGNTGRSLGAHLHFEIRDSDDNHLDPLEFGFQEIQDSIPPILSRIAVKTLDINARVEGEFERKEFRLIQKNGIYQTEKPIQALGKIGLELLGVDKMNGESNIMGIKCLELKINENPYFSYHLSSYPHARSRDLNLHVNYAVSQATGRFFIRCYKVDGNDSLSIYHEPAPRFLQIEKGKKYQIELKTWDAFQNYSLLKFEIIGSALPEISSKKSNTSTEIYTTVEENTLVIQKILEKEEKIQLKIAHSLISLSPAYTKQDKAIYLWDLRRGLPSTIKSAKYSKDLPLKWVVFPKKEHILRLHDQIELHFGSFSLYDTLYFEYQKKDAIFHIGNPKIPLNKSVKVRFLEFPVDFNSYVGLYQVFGKSKIFVKKIDPINPEIELYEWGKFTFFEDKSPPTIQFLRKTDDILYFEIKDKISGIGQAEAYHNGRWILMNREPKKNLYWIEKRINSNLSGHFRLKVNDKQGNFSTWEGKF